MSAPVTTRRAVPPGGVQAALLVMEHFWTWYRRNWRATAVSSVVQPLLMLVSFGVGLGQLVPASAATGGVEYLVYLAPGLLGAAAVQIAASEASYPVFSAFKWSRIYHAMSATPLSAGQVLAGQLGWIGLRMLLSGAAYLAVIAAFGGVRGPGGAAAALVFTTLCGLSVAVPITAFAATVQSEGAGFSAVFRFVILPMSLFSGTFFPVSQLPLWSRPLAWVSPLWHGTELARAAALGTLGDGMGVPAALGHTGYLLAVVTAGAAVSWWRFRVRLYV
jgi:lipooligosaccharide transport system permease protein